MGTVWYWISFNFYGRCNPGHSILQFAFRRGVWSDGAYISADVKQSYKFRPKHRVLLALD